MPDQIAPDGPAPSTTDSASTPVVTHVSSKLLRMAGLVTIVVAAIVVVGGLIGRVRSGQSQASWTREQAIPTLSLVKVEGGGEKQLVLPGDVQAFNTAPIHARVSGYLKRWYVDIGAKVKSGQVLADIDTPDLDQQVLQARADLATAQANLSLAATTAKRWQGLVAADAVSKQEADEKVGDLAAKTSLVNAARANLNRLLALESFKKITAPFDGVVTTRSADIGQLITTGSPSDAALFTVADQRKLRIYVRVPQNYSALVRKGQLAVLTVPEYADQTFSALVANSAQAVGSQSGAELVELSLDNADGRIKSGDYAQVTFRLTSPVTTTRIPVTAIQYRHNGPVVAVVGANSHVVIKPVIVSRDLGSSVEIGAGLTAKDRVVDNPPESLVDGDLIRVAGASAQKSGG